MPRLELIFLHSMNGGGCFRWRDEDSIYLQSELGATLNGNVVVESDESDVFSALVE